MFWFLNWNLKSMKILSQSGPHSPTPTFHLIILSISFVKWQHHMIHILLFVKCPPIYQNFWHYFTPFVVQCINNTFQNYIEMICDLIWHHHMWNDYNRWYVCWTCWALIKDISPFSRRGIAQDLIIVLIHGGHTPLGHIQPFSGWGPHPMILTVWITGTRVQMDFMCTKLRAERNVISLII